MRWGYTNEPVSHPQALGLPTRAELAEQKRQVGGLVGVELPGSCQ